MEINKKTKELKLDSKDILCFKMSSYALLANGKVAPIFQIAFNAITNEELENILKFIDSSKSYEITIKSSDERK